MRDSRICKKCNSNDVVKVPYRTGVRNERYNISVNMGINYIDIETYVCCNCGYVESWVTSEEVNFVSITLGEGQ